MKDNILTVSINQSIVSSLILITVIMFGFLFGHSECYGKSFDDLELNNRLLKPCRKKPNCVSSQSKNPSHQIQPIYFNGKVKDAKEKLKKILNSTSNAKFITLTKKYWHIEFTSHWWGFVDDVEILFYQSELHIDIRSASRVGYWDFGVNRKRVEKIRFQFENFRSGN